MLPLNRNHQLPSPVHLATCAVATVCAALMLWSFLQAAAPVIDAAISGGPENLTTYLGTELRKTAFVGLKLLDTAYTIGSGFLRAIVF